MPAPNRSASTFSQKALDVMSAFYATNAYPKKPDKKRLAEQTGETETRINAWFKSKRQKEGRRKNKKPPAQKTNKRSCGTSPKKSPKKQKVSHCAADCKPEENAKQIQAEVEKQSGGFMPQTLEGHSVEQCEQKPLLLPNSASVCNSPQDWFMGHGREDNAEISSEAGSSMPSSAYNKQQNQNEVTGQVDVPGPCANQSFMQHYNYGDHQSSMGGSQVNKIAKFWHTRDNQQGLTIIHQQMSTPSNTNACSYPGTTQYPVPNPVNCYPDYGSYSYPLHFYQRPTVSPYTGMSPYNNDTVWPPSVHPWWPVQPRNLYPSLGWYDPGVSQNYPINYAATQQTTVFGNNQWLSNSPDRWKSCHSDASMPCSAMTSRHSTGTALQYPSVATQPNNDSICFSELQPATTSRHPTESAAQYQSVNAQSNNTSTCFSGLQQPPQAPALLSPGFTTATENQRGELNNRLPDFATAFSNQGVFEDQSFNTAQTYNPLQTLTDTALSQLNHDERPIYLGKNNTSTIDQQVNNFGVAQNYSSASSNPVQSGTYQSNAYDAGGKNLSHYSTRSTGQCTGQNTSHRDKSAALSDRNLRSRAHKY